MLNRFICASFLCFSFFSTALCAKEEVLVVQELIARSERQLATQKLLKELIVSLDKQEELFIHEKYTQQQVLFMVETASKILTLIEENHYIQLFPEVYLEELRLFAKIAHKKTPTISSP